MSFYSKYIASASDSLWLLGSYSRRAIWHALMARRHESMPRRVWVRSLASDAQLALKHARRALIEIEGRVTEYPADADADLPRRMLTWNRGMPIFIPMTPRYPSFFLTASDADASAKARIAYEITEYGRVESASALIRRADAGGRIRCRKTTVLRLWEWIDRFQRELEPVEVIALEIVNAVDGMYQYAAIQLIAQCGLTRVLHALDSWNEILGLYGSRMVYPAAYFMRICRRGDLWAPERIEPASETDDADAADAVLDDEPIVAADDALQSTDDEPIVAADDADAGTVSDDDRREMIDQCRLRIQLLQDDMALTQPFNPVADSQDEIARLHAQIQALEPASETDDAGAADAVLACPAEPILQLEMPYE